MNKQTVSGLIIGLVVGVAATFGLGQALSQDKSAPAAERTAETTDHNQATTDKLKNLKGDDFDKAFLEEMIVHHEGAIDMAKLIETNAKHDELKRLGRDIMSAQSREIDMMQTWQGDWGYKDVPKSHQSH